MHIEAIDATPASAIPRSVTRPCATESPPLVSIVMPVYNESALLPAILDRVRALSFAHELIIVDDGSADDGVAFLDRLSEDHIAVNRHAANRGKGAALRTGFSKATGEIIVVQDADLEYDPADFCHIIEPIRRGIADVVYGSRFLPESETQISFLTFWANRLITWCNNRFALHSLSDVETCYKAIRREVLLQVVGQLREERFGIEIELAARLDKVPGIRIAEVPIRYTGRKWQDGKKIRFRDGLRALWCILKYHRSSNVKDRSV